MYLYLSFKYFYYFFSFIIANTFLTSYFILTCYFSYFDLTSGKKMNKKALAPKLC